MNNKITWMMRVPIVNILVFEVEVVFRHSSEFL